MAYKSFKEYIETNYSELMRNEIEAFVQEHHDGQGFHSLNVLSLLKQQVHNLQVMSLSCRTDVEPRIEIDVHVKADIVSKGLGTSDYDADRKTRWFTVCLKAILRDGLHGVETIAVDEYYSGKFDKENALDAYLVPYISSDQLEDLASFLDEQVEAVNEYSDVLVRRLIEKITVFDEMILVEFKSGLEIEVDE